MADVPFFLVKLRGAVQSFHEIAVFAQSVKHLAADARHDVHGKYHVKAVRDFYACFCEGTADLAHGVGDNVHCASLHAAVENTFKQRIRLVGRHPIVGGTCVLAFVAANKRPALDAGDVVDCGAVEEAIRQLLFVQRYHFACGNRLL